MFAIISNLLILDGFTDYNYRFVRDWKDKFIYLVEYNAKDMDDDGQFLCDKIEKRSYEGEYLCKISTDLEVPELHINCKININPFKLILNILDKMKVKIYFIVDLDYLLNKENSFEEILKELDYRFNFKIYTESIVYTFINIIKVKITNEQFKKINEIYTQMISNECNIFILNLKSLNSCLLDKLLKTSEEISVNVFNSEEIPNGKKKIIYFKQCEFTIDNDEELKIIEGLSYVIYFEDCVFGAESSFESNDTRNFEIPPTVPCCILKYNNIFYGIHSSTYGELILYDDKFSFECTSSYIDMLIQCKIKEKCLLLVKYYCYLVHEYILENSDIFDYRIEINDFSNIAMLNTSKIYEECGIDSFPDYSNEYFINDILNYKSKDIKHILNIIDKIRKSDNEGI